MLVFSKLFLTVYSNHFELDNGVTTTLKRCLILLLISTCFCITKPLLIKIPLQSFKLIQNPNCHKIPPLKSQGLWKLELLLGIAHVTAHNNERVLKFWSHDHSIKGLFIPFLSYSRYRLSKCTLVIACHCLLKIILFKWHHCKLCPIIWVSRLAEISSDEEKLQLWEKRLVKTHNAWFMTVQKDSYKIYIQ